MGFVLGSLVPIPDDDHAVVAVCGVRDRDHPIGSQVAGERGCLLKQLVPRAPTVPEHPKQGPRRGRLRRIHPRGNRLGKRVPMAFLLRAAGIGIGPFWRLAFPAGMALALLVQHSNPRHDTLVPSRQATPGGSGSARRCLPLLGKVHATHHPLSGVVVAGTLYSTILR